MKLLQATVALASPRVCDGAPSSQLERSIQKVDALCVVVCELPRLGFLSFHKDFARLTRMSSGGGRSKRAVAHANEQKALVTADSTTTSSNTNSAKTRTKIKLSTPSSPAT